LSFAKTAENPEIQPSSVCAIHFNCAFGFAEEQPFGPNTTRVGFNGNSELIEETDLSFSFADAL
jgi:hypothetical protein